MVINGSIAFPHLANLYKRLQNMTKYDKMFNKLIIMVISLYITHEKSLSQEIIFTYSNDTKRHKTIDPSHFI